MRVFSTLLLSLLALFGCGQATVEAPNSDPDGDGLTSQEEIDGYFVDKEGVTYSFDPTDPDEADTDDDGYTDLQEALCGSDTTNWQSGCDDEVTE